MNYWVKGLLIGAGVAAACSAVAFLLGSEKQRRLLQERYQQLSGALPEREQVQQYARQATARVSQIAGSAKDVVRQKINRGRPAGSERGDNVKQLAPTGN
jgi:hypothetical protein